MGELAVRAFPAAWNLVKTGILQVADQLSHLSWHVAILQMSDLR